MNLFTDKRTVLTLDAGGTNFVFSAICGGNEIVEPITLNPDSNNLELCLQTIIRGFRKVITLLEEDPVAISFAFPGPADYKNGVIGDLLNLPAFRGGIALGPMLEETFGLPTYINNDGDLFTYGESMAGLLPDLNNSLRKCDVDREYHNLIGVTLGTGFGGGIVIDGKLYRGENAAAGEIWLMRNFKNTHLTAEEGVSIRAVQKIYAELATCCEELSPKDIYSIAIGEKPGNVQAAQRAYEEMAVAIGESLANAMTLLDAPVVIGGGISGASQLLLPKIIKHLNGFIQNHEGNKIPRLLSKVYNLNDSDSRTEFLKTSIKKINIPFSKKTVTYNSEKKLIIGLSKLGTNRAVCLGAYAYALANIDHVNLSVSRSLL